MNKKLNDVIFDSILEQAFSDAFDNEIEEINNKPGNEIKYYPKESQKKQAYKLYNKLYKNNKIFILKFIKRALAVVVIILCIGNIFLLSTPTVSAAIKDTVISFMEKYLAFDFSTENNERLDLGEYSIGYIPKGFIYDEENSNIQDNTYRLISDETYFIFRYNHSDILNVNIDSENTKTTKLKVKSYDAYFIIYDNDMPNRLIWGDEEVTFRLSGNFNLNELLKIAESIKNK